MDVGTSKGLESFLAFLRETTERHRMAEADRAEAEAATQDLLHALELEAEGRSKYTIGELADEVVLPIWKL